MYSVFYFGVIFVWLSLLQNCCKSVAIMLDSRLAARPATCGAPLGKLLGLCFGACLAGQECWEVLPVQCLEYFGEHV